jgi:hypothetical protein
MAEQPRADPQAAGEVRNLLHELSQLLSQADHLDPEAQQELGDLVDQLGRALDASLLDPAIIASLTASTREMIEAIRHQHKGLLASARDGLQRLVVHAEDSHPVVTRLAERLIDMLSNIGI